MRDRIAENLRGFRYWRKLDKILTWRARRARPQPGPPVQLDLFDKSLRDQFST